jgi:hypothetical protein
MEGDPNDGGLYRPAGVRIARPTLGRRRPEGGHGQRQPTRIANLWIAGPGIFPTSGAPNPTYTILALSLRGAENLANNFGAVAG